MYTSTTYYMIKPDGQMILTVNCKWIGQVILMVLTIWKMMDNDKILKQIKQALDGWSDTQLNINSDAARELLAKSILKKLTDQVT